ncbi:TetR/AcrR family transcriptional regulator C-terminal domain-containing protein [Phytohabitans sp. ZYX-F-186]|uniref:TetR/AcrR family transcriptional regulator C-terminal domain-containing protein n=1 Tax=Phytohabitans maris TaxID=3071409 RepID=A0ABU0ZCV7_9ACTN|nr:TetR/AcrR family transcriptional regulator C-terminal domain-containing protein [Phytohabitans sp. ZYX-F-186]MDQ7904172.1 TetR/AcrR family transcriptional regulator C-terminal domain-containing protein [Phytohabitans sp. ZYX-F-186]
MGEPPGGGRAGRRGGAGDTVWLRQEPSRPRRTPPLTRERIVQAAVALLDEQGTEGLTVRRLAQRLGVTSTALYWHVKTKDDVLDLAVDHVFDEVEIPDAGAGWRDNVYELTARWRAVMLRHPWAPSLIGRPMLGPNVLARTEFLQSALVRGGLTGVHLAVVTRLLANYVIGAALTEATWRQAADPEARTAARQHIAANPAAYPTLVASGHLDDGRWSDDDLFERGVDAILATPQKGQPARS